MMTKEIDELQTDIGINLDKMIPTAYKTAWFFYERGKDICTTYWYCYIDAATGKTIPADGIDKRKDIIIQNIDLFKKCENQIIFDMEKIQDMYVSEFGKQWYGITYQLNADGTFNVSFSYEKPTGSLQNRREKWCMEHLGTMPPTVTIDMLREW